MNILFIQLSDLHIDRFDEDLNLKTTKLFEAVKKDAEIAEVIVIVVSGDVTNKGLTEEYNEARKLFDFLKMGINVGLRKPIQFIFVPGNHDSCFDNQYVVDDRSTLIEDIIKRKGNIAKPIIDLVCKVQNNFNEFLKQYPQNILFQHQLLSIYKHEVGSFTINYHCFNTSWMSMENEEEAQQPGKMYFPVKMFPVKTFIGGSDLNIAVLHHPHLWRHPSNSRELQTLIERTSDLVFVGHSHLGEQSLVDDLDGKSTIYVSSGAFSESTNRDKCEFKSVLFDSTENKIYISPYTWRMNQFNKGKVKTSKIKHKMINLDYLIDEQFEKWLDSHDAPIYHSEKDSLLLSDVFVYPQLFDLSQLQKSDSVFNLPLNSEKILNYEKENKILLLGDRKSGKTALLKSLYGQSYDSGMIPVYIDGSKIKSSSLEDFNKNVNHYFAQQYSKDKIGKFQKLKKEMKLIIVDDFDKSKLSFNNIKALFTSITKHYPNILISANNLFEINELITNDTEDNQIEKYKCYQITQMGHVLRSQLIQKWNYLEEDYDGDIFLRRCDDNKAIIDTILGKNFVPSYPFFVLTILQSIQQSDSDRLIHSSFGHYYDYLFRKAIAKRVRTNDSVDALFQFLPELAYNCFNKRVKILSEDELEAFRREYCKEYSISPSMKLLSDRSVLINTLKECAIIKFENEKFKFYAKYVYYFFLGRYFSLNIDQETIKTQISNMCKRLYRDEFANIILFIVHNTKNDFILKEILNSSKSSFKEYLPIKLESDIKNINSLINEIPKLVLENKNYMEHRLQIDKSKDNAESMLNGNSLIVDDEEEVLDPNEEIIELDIPGKINLTFRQIEILGLILKNHHSSIKGAVKYAIGDEGIALGLRSINSIFSILENNTKLVVDNITKMILQKGYLTEERMAAESKRQLFGFCLLITYCYTRFLAEALGNQNLSETFKDIKAKHDHLSYDLVDLAIKLNFYKYMPSPFEDVKSVYEKLVTQEKVTDKNGRFKVVQTIHSMLPYSLLLQLVQDYYHMFPIPKQDKLKLSSLFGIPMSEQNLLGEAYSEVKIFD